MKKYEVPEIAYITLDTDIITASNQGTETTIYPEADGNWDLEP